MATARACTIDKDKVYTPQACKSECGISREQLLEGRLAGVLNPVSCGRFRYYKGSELIAWVFRKRK